MSEKMSPQVGAYTAAVNEGKFLADEMIADIQATGNPNLLLQAVRKIVARGCISDQDIGFCHRISEHLIR